MGTKGKAFLPLIPMIFTLLSATQSLDAFLESSNLALCIGLLLTLKFYDLGRSIGHEPLIGQFLQNALQESLQTLYLSLGLGYFGLGIYETAQGYGKLLRAHQEGL